MALNYDKTGFWENTGKHLWGLDHFDDSLSSWQPDFGGGQANDYGDQPETEGGSVWFPVWAPTMTSGSGLSQDPMGDQFTTIITTTTTTTADGEVTVTVVTTVYNSAGEPVAQNEQVVSTTETTGTASDTSSGSGDTSNQGNTGNEQTTQTEAGETIEVTGDQESWNPRVVVNHDTSGYANQDQDSEMGEPEIIVVESEAEAQGVYVGDTWPPPPEESVDPSPVSSEEEDYANDHITVVAETNPGSLLSQIAFEKVGQLIDDLMGRDCSDTIYVYGNPLVPKDIYHAINEWLPQVDDPRIQDHWDDCYMQFTHLDVMFSELEELESVDPEYYAHVADLQADSAMMECGSYYPVYMNLVGEVFLK